MNGTSGRIKKIHLSKTASVLLLESNILNIKLFEIKNYCGEKNFFASMKWQDLRR